MRNVHNLSLSGNRCLDVIDLATGIVATLNDRTTELTAEVHEVDAPGELWFRTNA